MEDQLKHLLVGRGHGSLNQSMIDPPTCGLNPIWCTLPQIVHPIIVEASLGGGLFIGNLNDACGSLWKKRPYIREVYNEKNVCVLMAY